MPNSDFLPLHMVPIATGLDLNAPAAAKIPNLALPALVGMGVQAGAQALADFGTGISGAPTLAEQNVAARGAAAELAGLGMGVPAPPGSLSAFLGYHGTPHLFEPEPGAPFGAFKNEAIGTGEGAQAYGWGHYVAGNRGVAENYQRGLSGPPIDEVSKEFEKEFGLPLIDSRSRELWQAARNAASNKLNESPAFPLPSMGATLYSRFPWLRSVTTDDPSLLTLFPRLERLGNKIASIEPGNLLEVHIRPNEEDLLDWDRPLSEMSTAAQNKLKPIISSLPDNAHGWTGRMIYQNLARQYSDKLAANLGGTTARELGPRAASQALDAAGIPGLKYLDAGSRTTTAPATYAEEMTPQQKLGLAQLNASGQNGRWENTDPKRLLQSLINNYTTSSQALAAGNKYIIPDVDEKLAAMKSLDPEKLIGPQRTHNYVLFHPRHLRIVGRNGERLEPVDHDPFAVGSP